MHENELFVFLLATIVLIFVTYFRKLLYSLPAATWLYVSYCFVWLAWLATNLEHLYAPVFFNIIEHASYALNGILLMVWCWIAYRSAPNESAETNHD